MGPLVTSILLEPSYYQVMKVVHLNQPKIQQDKEIKELAVIFKTKWERRAREWTKKKYAALKQGGHTT